MGSVLLESPLRSMLQKIHSFCVLAFSTVAGFAFSDQLPWHVRGCFLVTDSTAGWSNWLEGFGVRRIV